MALPTDKDAMQLALIENRKSPRAATESLRRLRTKRPGCCSASSGICSRTRKLTKAPVLPNISSKKVQTEASRCAGLPRPLSSSFGGRHAGSAHRNGFLTEKSEARMLGDKNTRIRWQLPLPGGLPSILQTTDPDGNADRGRRMQLCPGNMTTMMTVLKCGGGGGAGRTLALP